MLKPLNVMGIIANDDPNACDAYRILYPLRAMELAGHRTAVHTLQDIQKMAANRDSYLFSYDIYLLSRMVGNEEEMDAFESFNHDLRSLGKTVIVDYDDDYTNQYRVVHENSFGRIQDASAVTVTNAHLQQLMRPYNRNVHIIPNYLVPELFLGFKRQLEGTVIGLTGSTTHAKDWQAVYGPLRRIAAEFPEVKIFCSGLHPEALEDLPNFVTLRDMDPKMKASDKNYFIPMSQYAFIHKNIDILLTPVDPSDRFNWSKSPIKALEGMMTPRDVGGQTGGACVISTGDMPLYRDAVKHGQTGLLVKHNDEEAWYQSILKVLADVQYRHKLQVNGHIHALSNFNIHTKVNERVAAFRHIMAKDARKLPQFTKVAAFV